MDRKIFATVLFLVGVAFFSNTALAATTGAANEYEVKIKKLELYNSSTGSWVTAFEGLTGSLDIASVAGANQFVGSFISGLTVADGIYTKSKVTPATAFTISGTISGKHTTATTADDGNGRTVSVASAVGSETACNVTILDSDVNTVGANIQDFSATPVTVVDGTADHRIRVYFDVSAALTLDGPPGGEFIYPNPPTVTVSIE